jgi:hypothetical protein
VAAFHQEFLDFFGEDEITLPGYQADQRMKAFQKAITERQLAAAGLSGADISEEEIAEVVQSMGKSAGSLGGVPLPTDHETGGVKPNMVLPQLDLPDRFKKAEQLTILTHPRWGQMFLPTYQRLKTLLEANNGQGSENVEGFVLQSLADPELNTYVWRHLAAQYPTALENVLRVVLKRPQFNLQQNLDDLMQDYGKVLEPDLPETASVPVHLHQLFQEAVQEVHKNQKLKAKPKRSKGFQ